MRKTTSRVVSLVLTLALLIGIMPMSFVVSTEAASQVTTGGVVTTPGATENYKYFKEDTSYEMTSKINTPMTIEFDLAGCANLAGAEKGGVIVGNYSEGAST